MDDLVLVNNDTIDRIILGQCYREATESPDTSTQIGAVIVGVHGTVKWSTMSYNGFVRGWTPTDEDYERPRKYVVTEHAERRAIYQAAKYGIKLEGCSLYSTWAACADCARAIVESGLARLVRHMPVGDDDAGQRWMDSILVGDEILISGGVEIVDIWGAIPEAFPILRGGEIFDPTRG